MWILLRFIVTLSAFQLIKSIESTQPQYSFRCLEKGSIQLFGLHSGSSIKNITIQRGNNCQKSNDWFNGSSLVYTIPETCFGSDQKDHTVHIVVSDPSIDVRKKRASNATNATTTTLTPIGGLGTHGFKITCIHIPEAGVNKNVVHVFQNKEYNELPANNMEVASVEMRFKSSNDSKSPDINAIYVGDRFFMFIEYMGSQDYSVVPKTCKAYSGTVFGFGNTVELWTNFKNISKNCTPNSALLKNFTPVNNTLVRAEMYGFRFSDSAFITISCEVGIYASDQTSLCTSTRKRRGIENVEIKAEYAASKLQVFDSQSAYNLENSCSKKYLDIFFLTIPVIASMMYH